MMTSAQVVETSVNDTSNSPSQDYTHPDDHNLPNYDMTPGFKPFTILYYLKKKREKTTSSVQVVPESMPIFQDPDQIIILFLFSGHYFYLDLNF